MKTIVDIRFAEGKSQTPTTTATGKEAKGKRKQNGTKKNKNKLFTNKFLYKNCTRNTIENV